LKQDDDQSNTSHCNATFDIICFQNLFGSIQRGIKKLQSVWLKSPYSDPSFNIVFGLNLVNLSREYETHEQFLSHFFFMYFEKDEYFYSVFFYNLMYVIS